MFYQNECTEAVGLSNHDMFGCNGRLKPSSRTVRQKSAVGNRTSCSTLPIPCFGLLLGRDTNLNQSIKIHFRADYPGTRFLLTTIKYYIIYFKMCKIS